MPTFCIQCALEAFVAADGAVPEYAAIFPEEPEAHMRLYHMVPVDPARRKTLEDQAREIALRKGLAKS